MKSHQLIGDTREIFFFKNHAEDEAGRPVPDLFLFFKKALYEIKASCLQFRISIAPNWHIIKKNFIKLQIIDPEICSILIFQKRVWEQFLHHILRMIFKEKWFSCYNQILLSDSLYFLRYWPRCVLQLFVNQIVTS